MRYERIKTKGKIFAIGDIHGCFDEFEALMDTLIEKHDLNKQEDTVIFLGDYVDRGPKSKEVIDRLIYYKGVYPHWQVLKGNHEHMMLDFLQGTKKYETDIWMYNGGDKTAISYESEFPRDHLVFMEQMMDVVESRDYVFVHAGFMHQFSLKENLKAIEESKDMHPFWLWAREGFLDKKFNWKKKIIFGHTPNKYDLGEPWIQEDKIGIDGAICPPGRRNLIAVKLPDEEFIFQKAL